MPTPSDDEFGFAPDYDTPVPYMQRTRDYYTAIGYTTPYRWAHYVDAPFQPLKKPLSQSRVTIVTTAAPARRKAREILVRLQCTADPLDRTHMR